MQVNIPESSLPTSVAWPQAQWLHEEVTAWIQAVVNPSAAVEGPLAIYNEKAWGITARFQCGSEQIVFKGCQLPLFAPRLATEALLAQHCAAHVPDYVAGRLLPNQETWTLYRYCAGVAVDKSDNSENTLPFFSLFRLLEAADDFVTVPEELVRTEGPLLLTPNQMAVRNAYLAQLPWQNRTARERAFDLAMCLAPIKMAYEDEQFSAARGRPQGNPVLVALCFGRALHYWQAMDGVKSNQVMKSGNEQLHKGEAQ